MGADHAERGDEAVHVIAVGVILRVGIAVRGRDLRVGGEHVIGFVEGFLVEFPVRGDALLDVAEDIAVLQLPCLEVGQCFSAEVILKAGRVGIHVDENEAAERGHLGLRERQVFLLDMREIPIAQHGLASAVDVPAPGVKRAFEL